MVSTFESLGGEIRYLRRLVVKEDKLWSAFNPSIGVSDSGSYAVAIRSSNYVILPHGELSVTTGGPVLNQVWFAELNDSLGLENLRKIDFTKCGVHISRGVEDPKLLWRNGRWMFTGVAMEKTHTRVARNCVCYLNKSATAVEKIEILPGYETKKPEKNWMTAYKKPKNFDYVYDGNGVVKNGQIIHRLRDNALLSALRGNAHLVELNDGTYLGVMHTLYVTRGKKYLPERFTEVDNVHKEYRHRFVRFDENGWAIEISDDFFFISRDIEFVNGFVARGDDYVLSFGYNDVSSHLALIPQEQVYAMLKSVD